MWHIHPESSVHIPDDSVAIAIPLATIPSMAQFQK
jgi:hypothetical protein